MEISSILIGSILLGVSLGFVSLPFRQKQGKDAKSSKTPVQTGEQRAAVLSALRDLDFDFKTGKVSEEDYTPLRAKLLIEAAQYVEQDEEEDKQLEALIQSRRAAHQHNTKCNQCGASVEANQPFCAKCGLPANHELCPHCGKKIQAGDLFCSSCGTKLEASTACASAAGTGEQGRSVKVEVVGS